MGYMGIIYRILSVCDVWTDIWVVGYINNCTFGAGGSIEYISVYCMGELVSLRVKTNL